MQDSGDFADRDRDAVCGRIRFLLATRWSGKQRPMARDLGVSQALISKVVNGHQAAGKQLLLTIAKVSGVNIEWLVEGQGPPVSWPERGSLPIARGVLPAPPLTVPQMLTGLRHPVAEAFDRDSRYWLELQPSSPILRLDSLRLAAGDLLLVECDPAWTHRTDLIVGRPCGVRLRLGDYPVGLFVGVLAVAATEMVLNTGDRVARLKVPPKYPRVRDYSDPNKPQIRRRVRSVDGPRIANPAQAAGPVPSADSTATAGRAAGAEPTAETTSPATEPGGDYEFLREDVVGVSVSMTRPNPFGR